MDEDKIVEITARYDADTKRKHRFLLEAANGVAGTIYINKDTRPLPRDLAVKLKMKGDE